MPAHKQITDGQLQEAAQRLSNGESQADCVAWLEKAHGVRVSQQALSKALRSRTAATAESNRAVVAQTLSGTIASRAHDLDRVFAAQLEIVCSYQRKLKRANRKTLEAHARALKAHISSLVSLTVPVFKAAGLEPSAILSSGPDGAVDVMARVFSRIKAEEARAEEERKLSDDVEQFDSPGEPEGEPNPEPEPAAADAVGELDG